LKKTIIMLLCLILLSACSSKSQFTNMNSEQINETIPNDLPQQLKEVDQAKMDNAIPYMSKSFLDLMDTSFFENGDRKEYYLKSHKIHEPGDQLIVYSNSLPRDGHYEVRFAKFNRAERKFENIIETTVNRNDPNLVITLPEEENVSYYLEEIQLNSKNEVLKKEFQRAFVLSNEVNSRIDIDKTIYSSGDTMTVTFTNLGTGEIQTGYGVNFEKWDGESWKDYEFEQMVPDVGIILRSGGSFSQEVKLKGFKKGIYRVMGGPIAAGFIVE